MLAAKQHVIDEFIPQVDDEIARSMALVIIRKLEEKDEITSDDVSEEMLAIARSYSPNVNPRVIGAGFNYLVRRGLITRVGVRNSERRELHHQRLSVWRKSEKR